MEVLKIVDSGIHDGAAGSALPDFRTPGERPIPWVPHLTAKAQRDLELLSWVKPKTLEELVRINRPEEEIGSAITKAQASITEIREKGILAGIDIKNKTLGRSRIGSYIIVDSPPLNEDPRRFLRPREIELVSLMLEGLDKESIRYKMYGESTQTRDRHKLLLMLQGSANIRLEIQGIKIAHFGQHNRTDLRFENIATGEAINDEERQKLLDLVAESKRHNEIVFSETGQIIYDYFKDGGAKDSELLFAIIYPTLSRGEAKKQFYTDLWKMKYGLAKLSKSIFSTREGDDYIMVDKKDEAAVRAQYKSEKEKRRKLHDKKSGHNRPKVKREPKERKPLSEYALSPTKKHIFIETFMNVEAREILVQRLGYYMPQELFDRLQIVLGNYPKHPEREYRDMESDEIKRDLNAAKGIEMFDQSGKHEWLAQLIGALHRDPARYLPGDLWDEIYQAANQ